METKVVVADITKIEVDALMVNLFEGVQDPQGATGTIDKALGGVISGLIADKEIKGKFQEITLVHTLGKIPTKRVVVVGLGKQHELTLDKIRQVVAGAARFLRGKEVRRIATIVHGAGAGGIEPSEAAQAIVEGGILGLYTFRKHITKEPETGEIEEFLLVERDKSKVVPLESGCATGRILAQATCLARDMINEPANLMTPSCVAETAKTVASEYGLECTVLERDEMRELGMGALLGVAQGSHEPPKFVIMKYRGDDSSGGSIGLIGKGITFDSGGISIKPSENMWEMKGDMSGAATVIAAMQAIAQLKPGINVTALVPATENLPGGAALKPGDVLTAINGKTIEIMSTDAEGRLILADALGHAQKLGISPLIDVATLTGACHIALGDVCTGVFTNNQQLADTVIKAGADVGEKLWQMPMYPEYKELNKSQVADIKNTGGRWGGAITAAQFLAEFTGDTPWVHLDIAGTFIAGKNKGHIVKGATGVVVRTLANVVVALADQNEAKKASEGP